MESYSELVFRYSVIRKQKPVNAPLLTELNAQLLKREMDMSSEEIITGVKEAFAGVESQNKMPYVY